MTHRLAELKLAERLVLPYTVEKDSPKSVCSSSFSRHIRFGSKYSPSINTIRRLISKFEIQATGRDGCLKRMPRKSTLLFCFDLNNSSIVSLASSVSQYRAEYLIISDGI